MFERFTERARQVVVLAQEQARTLRHNYIGTEHILLGLIAEDEGIAASVLASLGVGLQAAREAVVRIVAVGEAASEGQIPFTPRGKKVLELALREALALGHNYIGTEHILLGLVRESEAVGTRVLLAFNLDAEQIRNEVIRAMSGGRAVVAGRPVDDPHVLLARAAPEIRARFNRGTDRGDLLLVLASAPSGVVARALAELGVAPEALRASVDRARERAPDGLEDQLDGARTRKDAAIEAGELEEARQALEAEARLKAELEIDPLEAARRHLGL